jgi:hypothetical protein
MAQGFFRDSIILHFISHDPDETIATAKWPASALGVNGPIVQMRSPVWFHSFASISVEQVKKWWPIFRTLIRTSITQGALRHPAFRSAQGTFFIIL